MIEPGVSNPTRGCFPKGTLVNAGSLSSVQAGGMTAGCRITPFVLIAMLAVAGCGSSGSQESDGGSPKPLKATALFTGSSSACAIVDDGGVVCWGTDVYGLLATEPNSTVTTTMPTRIAGIGERVTSLSMGTDFACAVTVSGRVWCWSMNCDGSNTVPPFCLTGGDGGQFMQAASSTIGIPAPIKGLSDDATAVSVGAGFVCALLARGTVECWGAGDLGQTGNQFMSNLVPEPVSGLEHATAVSAAIASVCAITTGGGVVCWGDDLGEVGGINSPVIKSAVPVQVSGLTTGVTSLSVGGGEACAVAPDGAVCWGANALTQLPSAPFAASTTPAPVAGLPQGVTAVSVGLIGNDACAVTQGGGVLCWGSGGQGQLGNGSRVDSVTPVPVSGLASGVASVSVGEGFACALTVAGHVECWGAILGAQATTPASEATCGTAAGPVPCSSKPLPVPGL